MCNEVGRKNSRHDVSSLGTGPLKSKRITENACDPNVYEYRQVIELVAGTSTVVVSQLKFTFLFLIHQLSKSLLSTVQPVLGMIP